MKAFRQKTKSNKDTSEENTTEVSERVESAREVSEDAECCVINIDEVLDDIEEEDDDPEPLKEDFGVTDQLYYTDYNEYARNYEKWANAYSAWGSRNMPRRCGC